MKKKFSKLLFFKGFTLPELMISVAIIGIIATVITYNHQKFNSNLELTNVAYRVAVAIREAQVYGVSVKEFGDADGISRFDVPYGVHFSMRYTAQPNSRESFVFFGDSNSINSQLYGNNPNMYDGPDGTGCGGGTMDECIQRIILGRGNSIKRVCADGTDSLSNPVNVCLMNIYSFNSSYNGLHGLSIVFKRPKTDAMFTFTRNGQPATLTPLPSFSDVFICLQSPNSDRLKTIRVSIAGQISVEDPLPGDYFCN